MQIEVRKEIASLSELFRQAGEFFDEKEVGDDARGVLEMALEELFTNLVKYNPDSESLVMMCLEIDADRVTLSFTDYDTDRFDITEFPEVDANQPLSDRTPGGLGIHLVKKMSDGIEYEYSNRVGKTTLYKRMN